MNKFENVGNTEGSFLFKFLDYELKKPSCIEPCTRMAKYDVGAVTNHRHYFKLTAIGLVIINLSVFNLYWETNPPQLNVLNRDVS